MSGIFNARKKPGLTSTDPAQSLWSGGGTGWPRIENVLLNGDPLKDGSEDGNAWALAYSYDLGEHWRFALEWLRVESDVPARVEFLGEPPFATESKLEFSARYLLSGSF